MADYFRRGLLEVTNQLFKKEEDAETAAINYMFAFKNMAEHQSRRAMSYRKLCYALIFHSEAGKRMIDEDIKHLIERDARKIYYLHEKRRMKNLEIEQTNWMWRKELAT